MSDSELTMLDRALYELTSLLHSAGEGAENSMTDFTSGEVIRELLVDQDRQVRELRQAACKARDFLASPTPLAIAAARGTLLSALSADIAPGEIEAGPVPPDGGGV